eukprot:m.154492 g.154492  ORF g.154492 m.154492 type:complete len:826 (+) comp16387_c0_seq1:100-2577(+)
MTSTAVHLGWAFKQGHHRTNWRRRFFVLNTEGVMSYYADESAAHLGGKPKGKFQVGPNTEALTELACPPNVWPDDKRRPGTGFGIRTPSRTYYLYCTMTQDSDKWLEMIKTCIQTMQPKQNLLEHFSDEDDNTSRIETLSFMPDANLQALSNRVFVRVDELNNQVMGLESQLWKAEDVNQELLQRVHYLETTLRKNKINFTPMADGFDLGEPDDDEIADNADIPRVPDVDARLQLRAALILQRWWRTKLLRKKHAELLASFQQRRQTRQASDPRPHLLGDSSRATVRRGRDATRKERAPSTSLGLRKSVSTYAGAGDARRHTSNNRRPLPKATSLNLAMLAKQSSATKANNRVSVAITFAELDELEHASGEEGEQPEAAEDDGAAVSQSPAETIKSPVEAIQSPAETTETMQLWQRQHLSEEELASSPGTPSAMTSPPPGLGEAVIPEESSVTHVSSPTAKVGSLAEQPSPARKTSTASFVLQSETNEDIAIRRSRVALYRFNRKPHKGLYDLVDCGLVKDDPVDQIRFLCEEPGLSRAAVGELLGHQHEPGLSLLKAYAETFDFCSVAVDSALRLFLLPFRIPGEAQKIERVLTAFSKRYFDHNPGMFHHEDTALVLSFSIMMLHTDLHNDNNIKKMTLPEFVRNNRGIDEGHDIQEAILKGIYGRILKEEFQCCIDHTVRTEDYESRIVSKLPIPLVTEERVFVAEAEVAELAKTKSKSQVKRVVTLVVFNDLLLVLSRSRWERRYAYRQHYELQEMSMTSVGKSPAGPAFELHNTVLGKCVFKFAVTDEGSIVAHLRGNIKLVKEALNKDLKLSPMGVASEC